MIKKWVKVAIFVSGNKIKKAHFTHGNKGKTKKSNLQGIPSRKDFNYLATQLYAKSTIKPHDCDSAGTICEMAAPKVK